MITYEHPDCQNVRYKAMAAVKVPVWATNIQPYVEPEVTTEYVLFWLMTNGEPACTRFKEHELDLAYRLRDMHIRLGMRFVKLVKEQS